MKAQFKVLYRNTLAHMQSVSPARSPSASPSGYSSSQTAVSDLSAAIQNSTNLPFRYIRKLMQSRRISNKTKPISPCSPSSSLLSDATELGGNSPDELLFKAALPAVAFAQTIHTSEMHTAIVDYADAPATRRSTPPTDSARTLASSEDAGALKLEGVVASISSSISLASLPSNSVNLEDVSVADASHATDSVAASFPPITSSSSSSHSSSHSSYPATSAPSTSATSRAKQGKKRKPATTAAAPTRMETRACRPAGPSHLEYDYKVAFKAFEDAIVVAAYEIFGFPARARACSGRLGRDAIPALKAHPLVARTARAVDAADAALEAALARGETQENTPVPDEWRWGSEVLRPYEWARLPPLPERTRSRSKTVLPPAEPRATRSRKRRALEDEGKTVEACASEDKLMVDVKVYENSGADEVNNAQDKSTQTSAPEPSSIYAREPVQEVGTTDLVHASLSPSAVPLASSLPSSVSTFLTPTVVKHKRGRPRKYAVEFTSIQSSISCPINVMDITLSSASPSSSAAALSSASLPVPGKRGRGRPRKIIAQPACGEADTPTPLPEHPAKRQKI